MGDLGTASDSLPRPVPTGGADDLVGRESEVAGLAALLQPGRVVTLVGPAGVGKTRLAHAAASALAGRRSYWLDLGEGAESSIADAVARALGLTAVAEQDLSRQLLDSLTDQPSLLVLDNCERVLDAAGEFVEHVCSRSDQAVVLVASRERLDVRGELVFPVAPLEVPSASADAAGLAAAAAVRLLVLRAAQARPGFRLSPGEATAAGRICRRLDGLPLSIELAASRLAALTVREVADGIEEDLALLGSRGRRDRRHRSLTAALDWSHDLLDERERAVFRRLAVFPSGFTFDAALDVACAAGDPLTRSRSGVLDLVSRLIGKSFLTVSHEGVAARYRMLNVVREYARDKLRASGEETVTGAAHQQHYGDLLHREAALIGGRGEEEALSRLDAELDNVDAAVRRASQDGPASDALDLGTNLWRFCYLRGHYRRGREWLGLLRPLADTVEAPTQRARMLHGEGMLAFLECHYLAASRAFDSALSQFRTAGDPAGTADCLLALAGVAREQGRYERAEDLYAETLAVCADAGLESHAARARNYQAFLAWLRADYPRAEQAGLEALDELIALGDHEGACWAWLNLGAAQLQLGNLDGARLDLAEGRRIADAISFREGTAWLDHLEGLLAQRQDPVRSAELLRSALAGHRALGDRWRVASVLADLATAYVEQTPGISAALFGRADGLWKEIGSAPAPYERDRQDAARAAAAAALGERTYAAAWQVGRAAQPDQTLDGETSAPEAPAPSPPGRPDPSPSDRRSRRSRSGRAGAGGPGALEISALGSGTVSVDGRELVAADWGYAKPRELFFLLACSPPLGKDQIGARLWPELDAVQLRNALHTALRDLRKALGDSGWVVYAGGHYTLDLGHGRCRFDVAEFEATLASARASADPDASLRQLREAVALYRGDLLPAVDAEWAAERRELLRHAYVGALLDAGRELTRRRDFSAAATMYALAVDHDPFSEVAHRQLMASWARCGEPSRAAEHFREYARRLREELGTAPAVETRRLYQQLLIPPRG